MQQLFHYHVFPPQISHHLTELTWLMRTVNINISIFHNVPYLSNGVSFLGELMFHCFITVY